MPGQPPVFFYIPTISINKRHENLAASIGSTNEALNQFYSNDFDSLETDTFLGCFKLPPASRGWEAANNHMCNCKSPDKPVRQARKPSEGFLDRNTLIMHRRLII